MNLVAAYYRENFHIHESSFEGICHLPNLQYGANRARLCHLNYNDAKEQWVGTLTKTEIG